MSKQVLIFIGDDFEDLELLYPRLRLLEAGCGVTLAGQEAGRVYRGKHGYPCASDTSLDGIRPERFDGLVIPGGWMPDKLRRDQRVLEITRAIDDAGKLVASICHGPWIDISARIVQGVRYTSTPGIKDDLANAGALWEDSACVVDGHHVTSRRPDDLPEFCRGILRVLGL